MGALHPRLYTGAQVDCNFFYKNVSWYKELYPFALLKPRSLFTLALYAPSTRTYRIFYNKTESYFFKVHYRLHTTFATIYYPLTKKMHTMHDSHKCTLSVVQNNWSFLRLPSINRIRKLKKEQFVLTINTSNSIVALHFTW